MKGSQVLQSQGEDTSYLTLAMTRTDCKASLVSTLPFLGKIILWGLWSEKGRTRRVFGASKKCADPLLFHQYLSTWTNSIRNQVWRGPTTKSPSLSLPHDVTSTHLTAICLNCPCNPPVAEPHELHSCYNPVLQWENSPAGGVGKVSLKEKFTSFSATVARSRRLCL